MIAQIHCGIETSCSAGAKDGIDFVHSLPEPVQFVLYVVFGIAFICAILALVSRPFQ